MCTKLDSNSFYTYIYVGITEDAQIMIYFYSIIKFSIYNKLIRKTWEKTRVYRYIN